MANDNLRRLYNTLVSQGFTPPAFEQFAKDMEDEENLRRVHATLQSEGYTPPKFETFKSDMGFGTVATPQASQSNQQSTTPQTSTPQTGWKPSPVQMAAFNDQVQRGQAALQKQIDEGNTRLANIRKGGRPDSSLGEVKFNPTSGTMGRTYYTMEGEEVATPMQKSFKDNAWRRNWEATTPEGKRSAALHRKWDEDRRQQVYDGAMWNIWVNGAAGEDVGVSAAETVWSRAAARQKADAEKVASEVYKDRGSAMANAAFLGGRENHIMNAAANQQGQQIAHFKNYDLDRLMDEAWAELGKEGQAKLVEYCYNALKKRYPNADDAMLRKGAQEQARYESDMRMYNTAVEKNMPKDNLEYLFRKVMSMNTVAQLGTGINRSMAGTTGDMEASEQAMAEYDKDHKVLDIVGTVGGFAVDPLTTLTAGIGGVATKGALWLGGRYLFGRGAAAAGARYLGSTLTGRMVGGAIGGGVNFGTYEAAKEGESQFVHGGHINPETGENEGYSFGEVAKAGGHGLLMGGATGWITPYAGNVSDKIVRGTSSTAGKIAGRAGIYTGSTVVEGTIFGAPEIVSALANGNGEQAVDVWTDNIAMIAGFKGRHMFKSGVEVLEAAGKSRQGRMGIESRLREWADRQTDAVTVMGKDGKEQEMSLRLTKDEKAELEKYGYDLNTMLRKPQPDKSAGKEVTLHEGEAAPETIDKLKEMLNDPRVSEAARAKMYYYATGHILPVSTIMGGELLEGEDGRFTAQSYGANGIITSRTFDSRKSADLEMERIGRQAELNQVEFGERYTDEVKQRNELYEAGVNALAAERGWNAAAIRKVCEMEPTSKELEEVQKTMRGYVQEHIDKYVEEHPELDGSAAENIRTSLNEQYGVDIDQSLRKEPKRRSVEEQEAIDEYIRELFPEQKEADRPIEDAEAEDLTNQKALPASEPIDPRFSDDPQAPIDPRFDDGLPAGPGLNPDGTPMTPVGHATMKFEDRQVEVLNGRVVMFEDGTMVDNANSDQTIIIRDIETGKVEMVSPEAILTYEDYPAEIDTPVDNYVDNSAESAASAVNAEQPRYCKGRIVIRNTDGTTTRGWITDVVTEENYEDLGRSRSDIGKFEYYVEGDLQHLHYATADELDGMVEDFQPDMPVEGNIEGENIPAPESQPIEQPQQPVEMQPTEALSEKPAEVAKEEPQYTPGGAVMPSGATPVGRTADGRYIIAKSDSGETIVLDNERGHMIAHNGEGEQLEPYRPGANVGVWNDEQLAKLGEIQPLQEQPSEQTPAAVGQSAPAEAVPTTPENVPNSTETPISEGEIVPTTDIPVENVQQETEQTPLQRIPRNEKGEPLFEQAANHDEGWDALVEFSEGDKTAAKEIADVMVEEKRKAYEKAQKLKSKGKTPTEILASRKANAIELAKAQDEYERWQKIASVEENRQAAIRSQQEAEARQKAIERAEAEKEARAAAEEAARKEREALEGIPEWHMDTPENARARGARRYQGQMYTRQEPVQGVSGKEVEVKFSQKDLPKGKVAVIEASQLQPSHVQGQRNPMFFIDEAQPKNRSEAVSTLAAKQIAEGIRPEEIIGGTTAYTGAPTVNIRGEVIQGNNRSDALRYLWENHLPQQQAAYKQHIIDNAEQLGLDPEAVNAMQKPVLVNMLDVDDAEAIRLGQMTAQDTESGGIERIKPKNVAQKLGDNMRTFANQLLRSSDEEASFGQLVDRNGAEVLGWMNQVGAISNTQYQSAFDSKGNLTAEAKNDLQKVLYQAIFKGGSQQLEEMFDKLPAKAQRALLATAFRDMDSPFAGKLLPEIQSSIAAYNLLMSDPTFAAAKNMEGALRALEAFKATIALDDRFEQYMPADNFSNFALHLAAMYKASDYSQSRITSLFNDMYDLAQGKKEATLFEEADTTEYPLADVIKKVLDIDYKPAKNGNYDVTNGGADVALRNQSGQGGELRGNEPPAGGEQNPAGTEPTERGGGTAGDGRGNGTSQTDRRNQGSEGKPIVGRNLSNDESERLIAWMEENSQVAPDVKLTPEKWFKLFGEDGLVATPIAEVKMGENQYLKIAQQGRNGKLGMVKPTLEHPTVILEDERVASDGREERPTAYVFVKTFAKADGSRYYHFTSVTVSKDGHEVVISNQEKSAKRISKLLQQGKVVWIDEGFSLHPTTQIEESVPLNETNKPTATDNQLAMLGINSSEPKSSESEQLLPTVESNMADSSAEVRGENNVSDHMSGNSSSTLSVDKVNTLSTDKQISDKESSPQLTESEKTQSTQAAVEAASAEVDQNPTEAQKEAGNYKKGHVTIGDFDITIENPAGSVRSGVDGNGQKWETKMANAYGYIKGTESVDGDHIDVFLAGNMDDWDGRRVYVVDQTKEDGTFDEHKVMLGFNDGYDAWQAYLANYDVTWAEKHPGLRISEVNIDDFKKWIDSSKRKTKPFAAYAIAQKGLTADQEREQSYTTTLQKLRDVLEGNIPSVKKIEGQIRSRKKRIKTLQNGMATGVNSDAEREVAEHLIAKLEGEKKAFEEILKEVKAKMVETEKERPLSLTDIRETERASTDGELDYKAVDNVEDFMKAVHHDWGETPMVHPAAHDTMLQFVERTLINGRNRSTRQLGNAKQQSAEVYLYPSEDNMRQVAGFTHKQTALTLIDDNGKCVYDIVWHPRVKKGERDSMSVVKTYFSSAKPKAPINRVSIEEVAENLQTKGRAKLSDHATPVEQPKPKKRSKWISEEDADEFRSLRDGLRNHLGADENIAHEDAPTYGRPQLKEMDPEVIRMGTRMTYLMLKGGLRKFSDYAEAMVEEIGDAIRPHLKALYGATQNTEEVMALGWDEEMDDRKTVKDFDVYNFDKPGAKDIIETARHLVDERESQKKTDEIVEQLKEERNEKRKQRDGKKPLSPVGGEDYVDLAKREVENKEYRKSQEKAVTSQKQPTTGDLFGGLFDESTNTESNEKTEMGTRPGETGRAGQQREQNTQVGGSEPRRETERPIRSTSSGGTGVDTDADRVGGRRVSRMAKDATLEPVSEHERKNTHNNYVERGTDVAPKSEGARIRANIEAIETLKRLQASGESATSEDMKKLRAFSGWGGLGKAFNDYETKFRIRNLIGEKQFDEEAQMSRNSAYFTPANVVDAMWDVVRALGFKGGRVLEGSAGVGNVLGLMPRDFSERSQIHAVEKDSTTGGILSLLYPDANVDVKGFEETKIENGSIDLAITNVPFVPGLKVKDTTGDADLAKRFKDIHNFCIAKNVRKLRDGGIGVFITTQGTLDSTGKLFSWLTNEGNSDIVGLFRLHNETFGGTNATSDIIVVRKRVGGVKSPYSIDASRTSGVRTAEFDTGKTNKNGDPIIKTVSLAYNRHYVEHPEHMGGEMKFGFEAGDTSFRPISASLHPVEGKNQDELLKAWVEEMRGKDFETPIEAKAATNYREAYVPNYDTVGNEVKTGTLMVDSQGRLCVNYDGTARPLMSALDKKNPKSEEDRIAMFNKNKVKGRTRPQVVEDYNAIKKTLSDVLNYQKEHETDEGLQERLNALNRAFDTFVNRYGNLHGNTSIAWLRNDVDYPSVLALETYREEGLEHKKIFGKSDIFRRRVVTRIEPPKPKNVKDGVILSIRQHNNLDLDYIAEQLGMDVDRVKEEVINNGLGYEDPLTHAMQPAHIYLSGNVREKMKQAEDNNESGAYTPNINALRKVVPHTIPSHFIEFSIGSSWIRPELYIEYVKERTGANVKLTYAVGTWKMEGPKGFRIGEQDKSFGVRSEICNKIIPGHMLIEAAMTNRTIRVTAKSASDETISDPKATAACAAKVDEIREDFKSWLRGKMQAEPELAKEIEDSYNLIFNNSAPMIIPNEYVPDYFDGAARVIGDKHIKLREHQAKAVIRGTMQSLMLAHEVGTGKTFTLITTAMEMRRLGAAKKPMVVVQNATLGQFVSSAKALYPDARILSLDDRDRNAQGRKDFYAKIRYNDWDMVIIPQSVLEKIPDHPDRERQFIEDSIDEKMEVIEAMAQDREAGKLVATLKKEVDRMRDRLADLNHAEERAMGDMESGLEIKPTSNKDEKKAAVAKANAKVRAEEMLDRATDDNFLNFDDLGIDAILVDEAHEYKHLGFATAMQRGIKGVDPSYSKKCQGLYLKVKAVQGMNAGRNVIFATGTPISNTAAEIWTFMRYLLPRETMEEHNIWHFDDFVRNFGSIQQMLEYTTSGKYKENNRFAGYTNLPELARIWAGIADTVLTAETGEVKSQIPQLEGDKPTDLYLPQTQGLRAIIKYVKARLQEFEEMSGQEKKENSHIPLTMYGIAKAAAIDARLVFPKAPDDTHSKTNEAVRQTLRALKDSEKYKGSVAIFADNYQRKNKQTGEVEFNLFEDIRDKLIAQGIPAEQIWIMTSNMTDKKKEKIFASVNAGDIRVILGTTPLLGVGVNIQERLFTLMHLDAPNRPMDYWQRMGRLLRQGNLHKEMGIPVRVIRFGVEDSLDVTAYQRLKTKGAIADAVMNSKQLLANNLENRVLEEEGDEFGNITAELSGSEYAILQNQCEKELRKLRNKQDQHRQHQMYIHRAEPQFRKLIEYYKARISEAEGYEKRVAEAGKPVITIDGKRYDNFEALEDVFKSHNKKVAGYKEEAEKTRQPMHKKLKFSIGDIAFEWHWENDPYRWTSAEQYVLCPELGFNEYKNSIRAAGYLKRILGDLIENVMSGKVFRDMRGSAEASLMRNETDLNSILKDKGKEFEGGDRIAELEQKLEEYTALLQADLAEKERKYAEMDKEAVEADEITFDGDATEEETSDATASEPEMLYDSEESDKFADKYETADGKEINYTSEAGAEAYQPSLFDFDNEGEGGDSVAERVRSRTKRVQRQSGRNRLFERYGDRLNKEEGEFCEVERAFRESNSFNFTTGEKISGPEDVAFIFSQLEDAACEHSFAVFVKRGKPTVLELGMGQYNQTMVNVPALVEAYRRLNPDKVYFVHNHPSGNLSYSEPDVRVLRSVERALGREVIGVIVNLRTGKFGEFTSKGNYETKEKRTPKDEFPLTLYSFDRQVFADDYNPTALTPVRGSNEVAAFIQSHRLGGRDKVSILVASQSLRITANVHTDYTTLKDEGLSDAIVHAINTFGGRAAFVYGNFHSAGFEALQEQVKAKSGESFALYDAIRIEGEHRGEYKSANDGSVFEPGSEYGTELRFRIREEEPPRKTGIGYKVFVLKEGKLYPPMVANPGGEATPVGVWLDADAAPVAGLSKTGRQQVKAGGKGTQGGSGKLAYRPGWHLGQIPYALQFNRLNPQTGAKELFPANFVWAEVEYANDVDYQEEAMSYGMNANGKFQHSLAGLPRLPKDGAYTYRTNPNPETDPWIITGAMKVNRLLTPSEVDAMVRAAGREPQQRQEGAVSDAGIMRLNGETERARWTQTSEEAKRSHAEGMAKKFNTPIRIVTDPKELTHADKQIEEAMRRNRGFYDPRTGEVVVVLPNNADVEDVSETVLHEVVAHKGLREMVGEENYDAFCDEVYDHLKEDLKEGVDAEATRNFMGEPEKGYDHARRKAVDEMFGRMAEKDFEDFSKAERSIWAKLKAKVLEAINKFLGSLKLPKWVRLGDNELRYMLWRSHERMTGRGDYVEMARDAAKRQELGLTSEVYRESKEQRELRQVNNRFNEQLDKLEEGEMKGGELQLGRPGAVLRSAGIDGSKMTLDCDILRKKMSESYKHDHPFEYADIKDLPYSINAPIAVFESTGHGDYNILVDLSRDGKNFVVSLKARTKATRKGEIVVDEIVTLYPKGEKGVVNWINTGLGRVYDKEKALEWLTRREPHAHKYTIQELDDAAKVIKNFENPTIGTTESELLFRDSETGDIWKDRSVGLEERITNAAVRLANNQSGDLTLRNDAMRAIGGNLTSLRRAMALQRTFDQTTVKRVADLARILMQNGYLSGMTSGEVQRLLSAVKNSVGHREVKESVQKVMDIMIQNQLRNAEDTLRQLLSVKGSKELNLENNKGITTKSYFDALYLQTRQSLYTYEPQECGINRTIAHKAIS